MFMDPEQLSITQSKELGMWPNGNTLADQMYPYIKRMPYDSINILDVGVMKGETAYRFLELDSSNKIKFIHVLRLHKTNNDEYDKLMKINLAGLDRIKYVDHDLDSNFTFQVVSVNSETDLDKTLNTYYNYVSSGGIFCGNNHSQKEVKEALSKFRRSNKIGTPINVAFDVWFWWKR